MMKFKVLGANGGSEKSKGLTSFLIDDAILIDAGNVVSTLTIEEQQSIEHIIVSHSHLDHIKDIPLLIDNFIEIPDKKVNVYSLEETIDSLKHNFFNNIIFPDFAMIPIHDPILHYNCIKERERFNLNSISILPIKVNHTVPNLAFIIEKGGVGCVFISDTYKTDEIFDQINLNKNIKFVIIECSFPDQSQKLAEVSKHLTPSIMLEQIEKIKDNSIQIYIYHLKPKYSSQIKEEIRALKTSKKIEFLEDGMVINI